MRRVGDQLTGRGGAEAPPGWSHAEAGRGAEGSRRAVLRRPRYICPQSPGPPHSLSSAHNLSSGSRDAASARVKPHHGSVAATPFVSPSCIRAYRACALRSHRLSSAEAADASLFRSHGVSNRSPLLLQPPFPPFRSSRSSQPGLVGGRVRKREPVITVAQAQKRKKGAVGAQLSMRTWPEVGEGRSYREW